MKNLIKRLWGKIKLPLLIIIFCAGTWGWTTFGFLFPPMYQEAETVWTEHLQRQLIEKKDVGEVSQKATSYAPISEGTEGKTSVSINGDILPKIYQLESSSGVNDSCKSKGLVNGYGFSQSKFSWKCYKSKSEVEKEVSDWFEEKLQKYTLAQSACLYNTGRATDDCDYYEKFKTI